jgi:hypothetical protein
MRTVEQILVQHRVQLRLQDLFQHRQLGLFLRTEGARILEHLAVPIAQDISREPSGHPQHARLQAGRHQGLHEGLAGLEILAADGDLRSRARSSMAGMSVVRLGAPFANGTPDFSAA